MSASLDECVATFRQWLYLPDPNHLYVVLAAAVANLMDGDPVWLQIVGPPAEGKTEVIQPMAGMPWAHSASTLTQASLLSGTPKREVKAGSKGGLLREVGSFGVLIMKDFTSTLAQDHNAQSEVLAALREIYDGHWTRYVGTDGGRELSWEGKLGLIAGCTPTIDTHHSVIDAMGNRFIFYRMHDDDHDDESVLGSLSNAGREVVMRATLAAAVTKLLNVASLCMDDPRGRDLNPAEEARLYELARFAARSRSAVERATYGSQEVLARPEAEGPNRFVKQLRLMLLALEVVGVSPEVIWAILAKLALDAMPTNRLAVLEHLRQQPSLVGTGNVAAAVDLPVMTARRVLEDLALLKTVNRSRLGDTERGSDLWAADDRFISKWPSTLIPEIPISPSHTVGNPGVRSTDFKLSSVSSNGRHPEPSAIPIATEQR
jgi:hypothetical protein